MACDEESKGKLRAAEIENWISLKGYEDGPLRTKIIDQILGTIVHESPTEKIQRDVPLLKEIYQCKRTTNETMAMYANKFDSNVAAYIQQYKTRSPSEDQNCALLILRKTRLTADSINSLIFQLTTIFVKKQQKAHQNTCPIQVREDQIEKIIEATNFEDNQTAQTTLS